MGLLGGTFGLFFGIIWIGVLALCVYALVLFIQALKIYIRKNS